MIKAREELEVGVTYKVELDGDGVWGGEFTSKLIAIEEDPDPRLEIEWLRFENGVRMNYNRVCTYERQPDGKA